MLHHSECDTTTLSLNRYRLMESEPGGGVSHRHHARSETERSRGDTHHPGEAELISTMAIALRFCNIALL